VDLVRDVLDKKVVDRNGREMGRVDRIVLEMQAGATPRVAAIEIGPAVLATRLHPWLGRWAEALEHVFGVDEGRPLRIDVEQVIDIHDHLRVDLAIGETSAAAVEQRLRKWIAPIPGSS
jgi:sporulation protein YlmC with PRC-barrel domain